MNVSGSASSADTPPAASDIQEAAPPSSAVAGGEAAAASRAGRDTPRPVVTEGAPAPARKRAAASESAGGFASPRTDSHAASAPRRARSGARRFFSLLLAALLGGAATLAGAYGLMRSDIDGPWRLLAVDGSEDRIAALETRLSELAARPQPSAAANADTPDVRDELARLEQALTGLQARPSGVAPEAVAGVETRLGELEARLAQADGSQTALTDVQSRLSALSDEVRALQGTQGAAAESLRPALEAATGRLDELARRVGQIEGVEPPDLAPIESRLAAAETAASTLRNETGAVQTELNAKSQDAAALRGEIARLAQNMARVAQETGSLAAGARLTEAALGEIRNAIAAAQAENVALWNSLQASEQKIAANEQRLAATAQASDVAAVSTALEQVRTEAGRASAVAPAIATEALASALTTDRPFARELAAANALGASVPNLAALQPFAESGVPSLATLRAEFDALAPQLTATEAPAPRRDVLDRLFESARRTVTVRPVDGQAEGAGEPGDAPLASIRAALAQGDLAAAVEAWGALPADAKAQSQAWVERVQARLAAERAAHSMREAALTRLGSGS